MVTPTLFDTGIFSNLTSASAIDPGSKLYWYAAGGTTPVDTYTSSALDPGAKNTNPVIADANGRFPQIWLGSGSFKYVLKTSAGVTLVTVDAFSPIGSALSAATGSTLVGYNEGGASAVGTTVQARLRPTIDAVADYGCDNTGATNTTTKLKAFFDRCIATGKPGFIPAGTYKITPGVLAFSNGFVDTAWPEIQTAGYEAVTFQVDTASSADAAIIRLYNGTATGAGQYWRGGCLGGITFQDSRASALTYTSTHALQLTGCYGILFGDMKGDGIGGDPVNIPSATMAGNPDPYAVVRCTFESVEAVNNGGRIFTNKNGVGFTTNTVNGLPGTGTATGGLYGLGSGNKFFNLGMGSCAGWAIYDPDDKATNRNLVTIGELQNVENGIYLNDVGNCELRGLRFVHTYQTAPNTSANYWPRVAVSLGEGATPGLNSVALAVIHRIDAGGAKADVGVFTRTNGTGSANMTNVSIDMAILDNAVFGFTDNDLFTGFTSNGEKIIRRDGKIIHDTRPAYYAKAITSALSVPNGGYGASQVLIFGTQIIDGYGTYDPVTGKFTLQYDRQINIDAKICLTAAANTRVRFGVALTRGGVDAIIDESFGYAVTAGAQHYAITTSYSGSAGDQFYIVGDQNSGAPIVVTTSISAEADNRVIFSVKGAP